MCLKKHSKSQKKHATMYKLDKSMIPLPLGGHTRQNQQQRTPTTTGAIVSYGPIVEHSCSFCRKQSRSRQALQYRRERDLKRQLCAFQPKQETNFNPQLRESMWVSVLYECENTPHANWARTQEEVKNAFFQLHRSEVLARFRSEPPFPRKNGRFWHRPPAQVYDN